MVYSTIVEMTKRLRQISHALDKQSKFIQEKYHITIPQLICLWEIYNSGPITLGDLTERNFLNKSTVTGIVDRLEKRNFVKRNRISKDRRQIHVEATAEGIGFLKSAPEPLHKNFSEKFKALKQEERKELIDAINRIVELMDSGHITINDEINENPEF